MHRCIAVLVGLLSFWSLGAIARGHDAALTKKQVQEFDRLTHRLGKEREGATVKNLPGLSNMLKSFDRHALDHLLSEVRDSKEKRDSLLRAVQSIWYYRYATKRLTTAGSVAIALAGPAPQDLERAMVLLLREIEHPAMASTLEVLSRDERAAVRAMVGWVLPAFWEFVARSSESRKQWMLSTARRLACDKDPRVISSVTSHVLRIPSYAVVRALLRSERATKPFARPETGFLSWGASPLSQAIRASIEGHLRYHVERLGRKESAPRSFAAWFERAGGAAALRLDAEAWVKVVDEVVVMARGQRREVRGSTPALAVHLASFSYGSETATPWVTCSLKFVHDGRTVVTAGCKECSLGGGAYTTVSCDGPAFREAPSGGQRWKVFVMPIPATGDRLRLRVAVWVNRKKGARR